MSFRTDVPTSATRYFLYQPAYVKALQQAADCRALATTFRGIGGRSMQCLSDVAVPEAANHVVAIQNGLEQFDVRALAGLKPA